MCHSCASHFQVLEKNLHFQPCFGQNFNSQDANFQNLCSQDPSFFKENPLPRPYFWKPLWYTPTKKVECPTPRMRVDTSTFCLFPLQIGILHLKPIYPVWKIYCNFCTEGMCFLNRLTYLRNSIWNSPHPNVQHFGCIFHRGYQNFMW